MRTIIKFMLLIVLLVFAGCATTGADSSSPHRDRYTITSEEIQNTPSANTAWDLVQILRPALLTRDQRRASIASQFTPSLVYLNGSRYGSKGTLRNISALSVVEIQFVDGRDAGARYGTDASGGVFLVTTK